MEPAEGPEGHQCGSWRESLHVGGQILHGTPRARPTVRPVATSSTSPFRRTCGAGILRGGWGSYQLASPSPAFALSGLPRAEDMCAPSHGRHQEPLSVATSTGWEFYWNVGNLALRINRACESTSPTDGEWYLDYNL